jgi:hypothetical protein
VYALVAIYTTNILKWFSPGIVFTPAAWASLLDSNLSPIPLIASTEGPMKEIPAAS